MSVAEFFGYLASVLVFLSFYMSTMVALRGVAIVSNVAFITYASLEGLLPVLILHVLLLPTNVYRLHQIRRLLRDIAGARDSGFPLEPLIPFMRERPMARGEVLFRKGERSSELYYLAQGRVRIAELDALLQPGEIFGEIGLFAPENRRTGTAVAEDPGLVFVLSEKAVLQIFHQNPRMGFSLIRIITRRLIDNQRRAEQARQGGGPGPGAGAGGGAEAPAAAGPPPPPVLPDPARVEEAETVLRQARRRRRFARAALVAVPLVLLAVALDGQRGYLASVLFRDAVVTTWVYTATAPISGQVEAPVPAPGDIVASDGVVVLLRDLQADDTEVARLEAERAQMARRVEQRQARLDELKGTAERWQRRSTIYAEVFREQLEAGLRGLEAELAFVEKQIALSGRIAERLETLAAKGHASRSTADERLAGMMELASRQTKLEKEIALARRRLEAAGQGVFISADGSNPDWVFDSSDVLDLRLIEATDALAEAEEALARLDLERQATRRQFGRTSAAEVIVPPGSLVWRVSTGPEATVGRGAPLLEWIDCRRPLLDVPVSELDLMLIGPGTPAEVRIDGIETPLAGKVAYLRGAAARLGRDQLAAVAEAGDSEAQVVVALEQGDFGAADCPVGRAAYVDFAGVGPFARLLASLRW